MPDDPGTSRPKPARINGWRHVFAAGYYSLGGIRRLWRETAFRHELLLGAVLLGVLIGLRADLAHIVIAAILILLLIATEALNTALEAIVDHISPDWAEFARDAKDLGSLAVLCLLLANGIFFGFAVYSVFDQPAMDQSSIQIIDRPQSSNSTKGGTRP